MNAILALAEVDSGGPLGHYTKQSLVLASRMHAAAPAASRSGPARSDNRLPVILDAAARLFRQNGYVHTTMRDIARAAGMLAGSIYYHFPSKEDLLVAVYAEGVRRVRDAVTAALARDGDPWTRLERACGAHLAALLEQSDYGHVVIRVRPDDVPQVARQLVALRDEYERAFAAAIDAVPLPPRTDRRALKLMLLGALNWSQTWYRSGGESPQVFARRFVRLLRDPLDT
jgi:AcrR family transcriptional regulator